MENLADLIPDDVMIAHKDDKGADVQIKLKEHPSVAKFKDPTNLLKSYIESEKALGSRVAIPDKNSKPEDVAAFRKKIGVPDNIDGYKLSEVKDLHKSLSVTPEGTKAFLEVAHKLGIPNEAADKLNEWFLKRVSENVTAKEAADTKALTEATALLQKEWGDKFNENLEGAKKFAELLGGKEIADKLGADGSNPALLRLLYKCSTALGEDAIKKLNSGSGAGGGTGDPKKDAATKIDSINALKGKERAEHPYFNDSDPKHQEACKEMRELYKLAYTD